MVRLDETSEDRRIRNLFGPWRAFDISRKHSHLHRLAIWTKWNFHRASIGRFCSVVGRQDHTTIAIPD
ncbi:hypothetical protein E4U61_001698 [Claviceps capensis]|nr:hypothetical protein E4U61_001698 [Claviceps capensis]